VAVSEAERRAVSKANALNGAAAVVRVGLGTYLVPSATDPAVTYTVTGAGPTLADYRCGCPGATYRGVCWHIAATHLRRVQEDARAQWRRLQRRRQQEQGAAAPAAPTGTMAA
jgi:hypothetical protein